MYMSGPNGVNIPGVVAKEGSKFGSYDDASGEVSEDPRVPSAVLCQQARQK